MFTTICLFGMFNYLHVYITTKKNFNWLSAWGERPQKVSKLFCVALFINRFIKKNIEILFKNLL